MEKKKREETKKTTNEKPLSLYPLTPKNALKRLMEVEPPKKNAVKKPR